MKIVWFVDNKFRELYGLHDLKKNLSKNNIFYMFFTNLEIAIDFIKLTLLV